MPFFCSCLLCFALIWNPHQPRSTSRQSLPTPRFPTMSPSAQGTTTPHPHYNSAYYMMAAELFIARQIVIFLKVFDEKDTLHASICLYNKRRGEQRLFPLSFFMFTEPEFPRSRSLWAGWCGGSPSRPVLTSVGRCWPGDFNVMRSVCASVPSPARTAPRDTLRPARGACLGIISLKPSTRTT